MYIDDFYCLVFPACFLPQSSSSSSSAFGSTCMEVEDEDDWGSGGRELRPTIAVIVRIKAIDPLLRVGSHNILVVVNQGPSHDA